MQAGQSFGKSWCSSTLAKNPQLDTEPIRSNNLSLNGIQAVIEICKNGYSI